MSKVKGGKLDSFDIQARNPVKVWVVRVILLIIVAISCLGAYVYGYIKGNADQEEAAKNISTLGEQVLNKTNQYVYLNQQFLKLQEQYSHLELAAQIDASQVEEFRLKDIEQMQEMNELEASLSFYQQIMSPSDMKKGLTIEHFEIVDGKTIKAILTQVTDKPTKIIGSFQVSITGLLNGKTKVYKLSEVSSRTDSIKFGFKFFQRFSIDLAFPEGFEPQSVELTAKKTRDDNKKAISKTITWPSAK